MEQNSNDVCKKKLQEWKCHFCQLDLNTTINSDGDEVKSNKKFKISIGCDYCLEWYHLKCAELRRRPKGKLWMCFDCKNTNK